MFSGFPKPLSHLFLRLAVFSEVFLYLLSITVKKNEVRDLRSVLLRQKWAWAVFLNAQGTLRRNGPPEPTRKVHEDVLFFVRRTI